MNPDAVLFVDDEEYVLQAVSRLFDEEEIRLLKAANSQEALNLFTNNSIAVIVSDNLMPGMKGVELLSKVKTISPDTVRILMTGNADLATAIEAINTGEVFKFIVKPWNNDELVAIVLESQKRHQLLKSLKKTDESTLLSLAQTIELKDPYTRGHCDRVAKFALLIADHLSISSEIKSNIKYGSWLHDCGKIGIPEAILNKPGPLDESEIVILHKHPGLGADVALQAKLDVTVINIILYHHEWYGGEGYPKGIAGKEIPLEARIVSVADVFDALTSDRPYRKGFRVDDAFKMIEGMKHIQLDPQLVDIFKEVYE